MPSEKYLRTIKDPNTVITPIDGTVRFPESLDELLSKYEPDITLFCDLIKASKSSAELLEKIRNTNIASNQRMSLLKMFRRCVSPILDTETTKKITKVKTETLVEYYGHTFKPISKLKIQFGALDHDKKAALAALIGEYDTRGQLGYQLTENIFDWFEEKFKGEFTIEGPRRAGRDIELRTIFSDFPVNCPCDFIIRKTSDSSVLAIGFARYDSTRGGAQSDDRTGGNSNKVDKAREYCGRTKKRFRIIFLADGPGLMHRDTWEEACDLDGSCDGNVRVSTMKLAPHRITSDWLLQR